MINPDGFRLLCLLARWPQSPAERLALQQAIDGCRDWDVILRAASRHHIIPLIYKTLTEAGSVTVPDRTMSALRHKSRIGIGRALRIAAHTGTMISALDKAGIQSLALKGAALSCQLYGDLISRGAGDIDLLVDSETLWNADAVLRDIGYRRSAGDLPPQRRAAYARWLKDLHYARDGWPMIELHHRLTNNRHLLPRDFTTLWSRREIIQVGPLDIPTLARRDLPLYLCVHGAIHCWERLRWLVDMTELWRDSAVVTATLEEANREGLRPVVGEALLLAHRWLALPLAEPLRDILETDPLVTLLDRLRSGYFRGDAWYQGASRPARVRWVRLHRYGLKKEMRYLAAELASEWQAPEDWEAIPLPDALFWLYPFLRPVGWIWRNL